MSCGCGDRCESYFAQRGLLTKLNRWLKRLLATWKQGLVLEVWLTPLDRRSHRSRTEAGVQEPARELVAASRRAARRFYEEGPTMPTEADRETGTHGGGCRPGDRTDAEGAAIEPVPSGLRPAEGRSCALRLFRRHGAKARSRRTVDEAPGPPPKRVEGAALLASGSRFRARASPPCSRTRPRRPRSRHRPRSRGR